MGGIEFHILCVRGVNFTIHMLGETLKSIMVSLPIKFVDLGEGGNERVRIFCVVKEKCHSSKKNGLSFKRDKGRTRWQRITWREILHWRGEGKGVDFIPNILLCLC